LIKATVNETFPSARYFHTVTRYNNTLICFGGLGLDKEANQSGRNLNDQYILDLGSLIKITGEVESENAVSFLQFPEEVIYHLL